MMDSLVDLMGGQGLDRAKINKNENLDKSITVDPFNVKKTQVSSDHTRDPFMRPISIAPPPMDFTKMCRSDSESFSLRAVWQ